MNALVVNIIRFAIIIAVQVLALNDDFLKGNTVLGNISIFKPFVYILYILMLPININKNLLLIISLITGFVVDLFSNTYGLHACAAVLLGFIRPFFINAFINVSPKDRSRSITPSLSFMGFKRFFSYVSICTIIFCVYYYLLSELIFKAKAHYLVNVAFSSLLTIALLIISQIFFITAGKRRR
jgi:rod shape-determining protein MreD